jgi:hypothetical protein
MKYLFILFTTLTTGFLVAQRPSIKFEATTPRLAKVDERVCLKAIASSKDVTGIKWKISGEQGKDWKFMYKEGKLEHDTISIVFKKIGPTNISISAKASVDSIPKGKKDKEKILISLKYDRKGYLLITEPNEYSELNQLFAEGTVDSYIKLVKKASKLTENEKYAKDPFAWIWLSRGLYSVHNENLDYTQGKYEPYKSAFNDAISALSKAMKYDNNNFLEESKFAEFIYELQFRYFDDIVASTLVETEEQGKTKGKKTTKDFGKINGSLAKYIKITKNPICIKHLQSACMLNLNDANAKNTLKEAEAELVKYTASRDSVKFSPTDELFFATGVTELLKYYEIKKKTEDACSLQKRAEAALPELSSDRKRFEEWIDQRDPTGCN